MATPAYSIYIDGKIHKAFPSGDSTTDRTEAEEMYDSLKRSSYSEGTKLELRVSSRGIEEPTEQDLFLGLIRELYEAGFSVPEIADVSGKSERTVRYNLSKLKAANKIESHGRGRPVNNTVRETKAVTIQFYKDNYDFLMKKCGNITGVVNDLVDKYRKELEETDKG